MNNNFEKGTFDLFDRGGYAVCWERGTNDADCLHHILGRVSDSPYNAAPLNNKDSHMPEGRKNRLPIHHEDVRRQYLKKTKLYLDSIGYQPTDKDLDFLKQNERYYQ